MLAAEEPAEAYHVFRMASGEEYAYKYMKIELYDWRKEDETVEVDDVGNSICPVRSSFSLRKRATLTYFLDLISQSYSV